MKLILLTRVSATVITLRGMPYYSRYFCFDCICLKDSLCISSMVTGRAGPRLYLKLLVKMEELRVDAQLCLSWLLECYILGLPSILKMGPSVVQFMRALSALYDVIALDLICEVFLIGTLAILLFILGGNVYMV